MHDILIVDDEEDIRELISDALQDHGYITRKASGSTDMFDLINKKIPTVVVLDIWLQGSELDGLGILEILRKNFPLMPVIMISGHGTIETAVNAIKMGAYDYIEKPFTEEKLLVMLKRACETLKLQQENEELKLRVVNKNDLIGTSPSMIQLRIAIEKIAVAQGRVLITGPVGCKKEMVARMIHKKSKRAANPFLVLNLSGKSEAELELEVFGEVTRSKFIHNIRKRGLLEQANQGSLYINELGLLPLGLQGRLLRFLQDQTIEQAGQVAKMNFDVRIISASSQGLEQALQSGKFRPDLYNRLNVMNLTLDPLSARRDDIKPLCEHFVADLSQSSGLPRCKFSDDAIATMQAYSWPGNVSQLKNVVEWVLIMHGQNDIIRSDMLPSDILSDSVKLASQDTGNDMMLMPLREAREIFEKQYLSAQMNRFNGNISRTSQFVGMERSALHRKLKSLNIYTQELSEDAKN
jgi:two-component system nitrogen regulation response regulator NtrX